MDPKTGDARLTASLQAAGGRGYCSNELFNHTIGRHPLGFGVEIRNHTMPQYGLGQRMDVLDRDVMPPVNERARLAAENQRRRRAQAGAPLDPLLHEIELAASSRPRAVDEVDGKPRHLVG